MKRNVLSKLLFLLAVGVLLGSCKKEGPEGPEGPKGEVGPKGDKGDKGDVGNTGTANVIFSEWLPIPAPAANLSYRKNFSFSAPKLTQEILDKGLVYGYLKHSGGSTIPLPYAGTYTYTATGEQAGSYLTTILLGVGSISLNQDWLTPGAIPSAFATATGVVGGYTHFRYVIIPGGTQAKVGSIDYKNYEAVKAYYNLGNE